MSGEQECQTILWHRLDQPGHDYARLTCAPPHWRLDGTAVFVAGQHPCCLRYQVICTAAWHTIAGMVDGWRGAQRVFLHLVVDADHHWWRNGQPCPQVAGCLDLDLSFTPATNLLAIRRLNLDIGQQADAPAAWLRFPAGTLESLPQSYRRVAAATYHYESDGGEFITDLTVHPAGFITSYPGLWECEAMT